MKFDYGFITEALYDKFKKVFAEEIKNAILNQDEFWIENLGYITSEIKSQGTKSGAVINNVKFKFVPSDGFKEEVNKALLNK